LKLLTHIPRFLTNKFLLAGTAFLAWMFFFDPKDIPSQLEKRAKLRQLQQSERLISQQITDTRKESGLLKTKDVGTIEKYARENYLMKKDNEDIFLVTPTESK
jgi:cell division protein FtsB